MELRIEEGTPIEPPVVKEDGGGYRIEVPVADQTYAVSFPEARRADVIYGLTKIIGELENVGS